MLLFFYLLASMGVGYWAKLDRRNPALWFAMSVICTRCSPASFCT